MATRTSAGGTLDPELRREPGVRGEADGRPSIGDLLRDLASESAALVRGELELAKQEVRENLAGLRSGLVIMAVAALVAWVALLTLCSAAIMALAPALGGWLAGLLVAVGLAVVAGLLFLSCLRSLKRARFKPQQTIDSLREDKQWLKRMT